tara:strand:- start:740 stop:1009 length:270 start_codon:yes stop_codon:yes gene_type:complete
MENEKVKKLDYLIKSVNECKELNIQLMNDMNIIRNSLSEIMQLKNEINIIKENVLEVNYKIPERQPGYLWDTWSRPKDKPTKVDWDSVQ